MGVLATRGWPQVTQRAREGALQPPLSTRALLFPPRWGIWSGEQGRHLRPESRDARRVEMGGGRGQGGPGRTGGPQEPPSQGQRQSGGTRTPARRPAEHHHSHVLEETSSKRGLIY